MKPDYLNLQVPDMAILFEHGPEISPNEIYRLLSFPRESLIQDCRALVQHAYQYETTYQQAFVEKTIEANHLGFVYHAIQILAELGDELALRAVASFLVQDWESYSFWFGNLRPFWSEEVLYLLGKNQLSVLAEAYMAGKGHLFARASAAMAVARAAWVNPQRKVEVESLFGIALDELETWGESLFGTERMEELGFLQAITPVIVEEAHQLGMEKILRQALALAENPGGIGMEAEKIQSKLQVMPDGVTLGKAKISSILDRYATVAVGFDQILHQNPLPQTPLSKNPISSPKAPIRKGPKVGRNEPCPCGSGKKYKKCHGVGQ